MIDTDLTVEAVKARLADPIEFAKIEFKYDAGDVSGNLRAVCRRRG